MNFAQTTMCAAAVMAISACSFSATQWSTSTTDEDNGSTEIVTRTESLPSFTKLEVGGSFDVTYVKGEPGLKITGAEVDLNKITTSVTEGELEVITPNRFRPKQRIELTVTTQNLTKLDLNGSVRFETEEALADDYEVNIELSGSGSVKVKDVKADEVTVDIEGSGSFDTNGLIEAGKLKLEVNGSGDVNTGELKTKRLKTEINGTGDIVINSVSADRADMEINGTGSVDANLVKVGNLKAEVNGVGKINLRGNRPGSLQREVNGVGKINTSDLK